MKRIFAMLCVLALLAGCTQKGDAPGIYDVEDWEAFVQTVNAGAPPTAWEDADGVVRLRGDLNLKRWKNPRPVGQEELTPFRGTFDGGNYTISGLKLKSDSLYVGLFGINRGTIRRLTVDGRIEATNAEGFVGAVCAENLGRMEMCKNLAEVVGAGCVGGVVGRVQSDPSSTVVPLVSRCENIGAIKGSGTQVGGLVGWSYRAKVVDGRNVGAVIGTGLYAGGVIGLNGGLVRGCRNEAPIRGRAYAGGVVGANSNEGRLVDIDNYGPVMAETIGDIVGEDFTQTLVDEDTLREHYHQEHEM